MTRKQVFKTYPSGCVVFLKKLCIHYKGYTVEFLLTYVSRNILKNIFQTVNTKGYFTTFYNFKRISFCFYTIKVIFFKGIKEMFMLT